MLLFTVNLCERLSLACCFCQPHIDPKCNVGPPFAHPALQTVDHHYNNIMSVTVRFAVSIIYSEYERFVIERGQGERVTQAPFDSWWS